MALQIHGSQQEGSQQEHSTFVAMMVVNVIGRPCMIKWVEHIV